MDDSAVISLATLAMTNPKYFRVKVQSDRSILDARTKNGATLLYLAVLAGDSDSVSLLLELGIDADLKDNWGRTALDVAEDFNANIESAATRRIVDLLRSHRRA
jgi:ankyrin repeat protein